MDLEKKKRGEFLGELKAHWIIKVLLGLWLILGSISTAITYGPPSWQKAVSVAQYFPKWQWYVWIIGILLFGFVVLFESAFRVYSSASPSQPSLTTAIAPPPSPVNIVFKPHIENRAGNQIAHSPAPQPKPIAPKREKVIHIEKPMPLVARVSFNNEYIWKRWNDEREGLTALILPFYLDATKSDPGISIEYAQIHLTFSDYDPLSSIPPIRIDRACWLNEYFDTTTIELGETKYVVLAVQPVHEDEPTQAVRNNRTNANWSNKHDDPWDFVPLPALQYSVSAVLIWGGNSNVKKTFEFDVDLTKPLS